MKNISIGLNVVLLLAVGFLFYKTFWSKDSLSKKQAVSAYASDSLGNHNHRMAFFNIDSVESSFELYKTKKKDFEQMKAGEDAALKSKQDKFSDRLMQLQQMQMTPEQQEKARQELDKMQRDLQDAKNASENNIYKKGTEMTDQILKMINDYLKVYNTPQRFDYIIEYNPQMVFYKDSSLDITSDLVKGLNETYKKKDN